MHPRARETARIRAIPWWLKNTEVLGVKRVAFCTFGCRLNQYDTETVRTLLEARGAWRSVGSREEADLYVVNTCSVTARADATARKAIRRLHAEHPEARIAVTGCYAQRAPRELADLPGVALVVGAADKGEIAARVDAIEPGETLIAVSPIERAKTFIDLPISEMMEHSRAYVKVQEGCNNSCTFCIVPSTRGASRSRPFASVVAQVQELVANGYAEIVLTGVHIGDYGIDLAAGRRQLPELIRAVLAIPGVERFRLSSIEPASVSDEIIEMMAGEPRFARHFHIPLQSASDSVLARMRRHYRGADFAALVRRIAAAVPDCGIGSDVICGFPGESDDDFMETFALLHELPISYIHPFTYSVRPGSEAEAFGDQVSGEVKKRRTRSLKRLSADKGREFRNRHLGKVMEVLVEDGRGGAVARRSGWTDNYLRVELPADAPPKGLIEVRITGLSADGLVGERWHANLDA